MLPSRYRLRHATDIVHVRQKGKSWRHPLLVLLVCPASPDQQVSRFGFLASRRVGNAVVRNRCKRLMREAVRQHLQEMDPQWDCLFIARGHLVGASFVEVEKAVLDLLTRSHVRMMR